MMTLVYPPWTSRYLSASSEKSLRITEGPRTKEAALLRARRSPCFPKVIIRSTNPRTSLALASVVLIRSCKRREEAMLRNIAMR